MAKKWVYLFNEGKAEMRNLLGGKGANLAEMTNIGLPVPPGFTITTEACNTYNAQGNEFPDGMWDQVLEALREVERETGKKFGDKKNPLLLSVRSGARASMPGMMDTVLNLGLNPETLQGLAKLTENQRLANDAYRRLIQMFGRIVMGVKAGGGEEDPFEKILGEYKAKIEGGQDTDLTADMLAEIALRFKEVLKEKAGREFPDDPYEQLRMAVASVFDSWMGKRAVDYRNFNRLPHNWGTAVNVQTMVFGNMGSDSGTGVAFTRNPATGEKALYGEYLVNAQGEDVVSGIRTPSQIGHLKDQWPKIYEEFSRICDVLEKHYRDVQDMEFTIEKGRLWMLQTRTGKRTGAAAVKIAVDMVREGLIDEEEAVMRIDPLLHVNQLLLPRFDPQEKMNAAERFLAKGLNASPGAASGVVALTADTAEKWGKEGRDVILVRPETAPDDVHGMLESRGILTQRGGATSHAAVVARGLGLPCVAGCEAIRVDLDRKLFSVDGKAVKEGDVISINGTTGEVFAGPIATIAPEFEKEEDLVTLLAWADKARKLGVRTNADYPKDAAIARKFGAEGIGLTRTEHMFFEGDRVPVVQQMILAKSGQERQAALDKLLPVQRGDFEGIFEAMDGLPVIIRLIDPPLHEFLPSYEELLEEVVILRCKGDNPKELAEKEALLGEVSAMREANPMLGLRGCRLGITMPGITEMQVRAIFQAACRVAKRGIDVHPEVMIPLVGHVNELKLQRETLEKVAEEVMEEEGTQVEYTFGTMIELPRAALTAGEIAQYAQFFSFGTNDLTQTTFGYSRDDAEGKFLLKYVEDKVLTLDLGDEQEIAANPFQSLDRKGVGRLIRIAFEEGRAANPDLEVGICGEHGGDPSSIEFCHQVGLDYVSCSPYRVPVARVAAAQAAIKDEREVGFKDV